MENNTSTEEVMSVAAALLTLSELSAPAPSPAPSPAPAQAVAPPPGANETEEQQEESQDSATNGTSSGEGPSRMVEEANENVSSSASSSKPTATRNIRKKRKVRGLSAKVTLLLRLLKKKALYQKCLDACKRALGRMRVNRNTAPSSSESPSDSRSASPSEPPSASPSESQDDGKNKNTNTTEAPRPSRRPREPTEEDSGNDKKRRKSRLGDFAKKNVIVKIEDSTPEEEWVGIGTGKTTIHRDEFQKVKWGSHAVATRSLLVAVFGKETLATHSLTGKKSPAYQNRPAKQCLDPTKVNDIIAEVTSYFPVTEKTIKSIITIKCADECKMERVRVQRAENGVQ